MIDVLEDRAGTIFSKGLREHLSQIFLDNAAEASESNLMRDFALVEAASYWHRPGFAMEDVGDRASGIILEREKQQSSFTPFEEMQLAIAHEALYFMRREVEGFTPPELLQL